MLFRLQPRATDLARYELPSSLQIAHGLKSENFLAKYSEANPIYCLVSKQKDDFY